MAVDIHKPLAFNLPRIIFVTFLIVEQFLM
jgi:hypothetical protein